MNDHYDRIGERDAKYTRELCIRMVRVITLVRHVGRPVKIRTTFAPAPIVSLSFFYPSLRTRVVKKKKGTDRRGRVCIIHTWVQDIRGGSNIISLVYPPVCAPFIPFTSLPWRGYFALFNISSLLLATHTPRTQEGGKRHSFFDSIEKYHPCSDYYHPREIR